MFIDLFVDSADNNQVLAFKIRIAIDNNYSSIFYLLICKFSNKQNSDSTEKFRAFHSHLRIPLTFCGVHLQLRNPEQLAIFACCRNRSTTNVPRKLLYRYLYAESMEFCKRNPKILIGPPL